ncbi:MAG TPA: cytochrome oxidase small assembly protein [Casimicrobiaceae bacterium]
MARRANRRTALTLLSVAAVFFGGIIASQYTGGTTVGIVVVGLGLVGFLLAAVLRDGHK